MSASIFYLTSGPMTVSAENRMRSNLKSNQIKKFYLKSLHFITVQHKLSRTFLTDMHTKIT
jgi:hypothetical protein